MQIANISLKFPKLAPPDSVLVVPGTTWHHPMCAPVQEPQVLEIIMELKPNNVIKDHRYLKVRINPETTLIGGWKSMAKCHQMAPKPNTAAAAKIS